MDLTLVDRSRALTRPELGATFLAMTIDDIYESFEFLDGWEERYGFIIELGRQLPPMDPALKTAATKVDGCMSQVWMLGRKSGEAPPRITIVADSDAMIVKGLIAVLLAVYSGRTPREILDVDIDAIFERLGFAQHISVNRRNGFYAMVERIKGTAAAAL